MNYVEQSFLSTHIQRIPVIHLSHIQATTTLADEEADIFGLSLLLSDDGDVEAVAFATSAKVFYVTLLSYEAHVQTANSYSRRGRKSKATTIAGFAMARLALLLHQSQGWHTRGVDLSTLLVSTRERPYSPAKLLSERAGLQINRRAVDKLWYTIAGDETERMRKTCLRAWISAICAETLSYHVHDAPRVDTDHLTAEELTCLGRMAIETELVTLNKPLSMENDFHTVETGTESGTVVIQNTRYKTRVRQSETTTVAFETKDGKRLEGQAIRLSGRQTTVLIKGKFRGDVTGVTVLGREEQTNAEVASDSFVLRLLQGQIALKTAALGLSERWSAFIDMIWFPSPDHQYRRVTPPGQSLRYIHTPLLKSLNVPQREVVEAMLSDHDPLVIVQGPPGTGKTTTIAAAVEYWISQETPVWVIAQSNVAVKNIARSFIEKKVTNFKIIVSKEFYVEWHEDLYMQLEGHLIRSDDISQFKDAYQVERLLNGSTVVLCTLCTLSNPALDQVKMWDVLPPEKLVIDEGSQINVFEFLHVFHKFRTLQKVCFFGDPQQLPPHLQETVKSIQSIFDVTHLRSLAFFLNKQYRMPVPIGEFISREMYDSRLESQHSITTPSCVAFVNVAKGQEESCGKSWVNIEEVNVVVTLVRDYYQYKDYCVITPYDAQRTAIQKALKRANLPGDRVFNVDSFQGHEAKFIIVSTVRTSKPGFLTFNCRTNVMLSRCKEGMILVTNYAFVTRVNWTLIGKLAAHWNSLLGPYTTWTDWRRVLENSANLPGARAPRSFVPAPVPVVVPDAWWPTLAPSAVAAQPHISSMQRTSEDSTALLYERMARLRIGTSTASGSRLQTSSNHFPTLGGADDELLPELARLKLKGSWKHGSAALKY